MKPIDPKTLPTVSFTETQAKARRLDMLIADIDASKTYNHAFPEDFCGTPACAWGHFWANEALAAEGRDAGVFMLPDSKLGSPYHTAELLGIDVDCFQIGSPLHDGTKAGVLAYLRGVRAEMG